MDLRPIDTEASDEEKSAVDAVLGVAAAGTSRREAKAQRHLMLPALHAAQGRVGWVSPGALGYICRRLHVPPAEGYGVASFYALLSMTPRPPTVVHLCDDIACKTQGADALCREVEATLGPPGVVPSGRAATRLRSPCLGLCEQAPAAMRVAAGVPQLEHAWGHASAASVIDAVTSPNRDWAPPADVPSTPLSPGTPSRAARTVLPQPADAPELRLLRRVGRVDPGSLDDYRAEGGFHALRRALEMGPAWTLREISDAKLVGRGGAAFPTGRKWEAVARASGRPRYVVCNADESEPGTFKDRILMEDDPYAVIEAMTVCGVTIDAEKGFLYIRGEYPLAHARLAHAIVEARGRGLLGDDIMGRGRRFDIELRRGGGAYICGEETALFNSIEGLRGEPRNKPPFPVEVGLFGKPTCVNNVETLVATLEILVSGAAAWSALGTAGSTGSKLFCVSGHVRRPGIYEVPLGTRLDALIALAGGVPEGRRVQTVLLGGAAGSFVTPDELSVPLTFEDTRRIGATLGSGVVLVFDDTAEMLPMLSRIASFFRDESCGQCVPCRVGTVRQEELVARLASGRPLGSPEEENVLLKELGQAMRDASICGLGQTASSAIESALHKLRLAPEMP